MSKALINGTELYYVSTGEGLPFLVMHGGLGFDHTYLHPWLDPLGDLLHLVYYDHRGNGRSGRPAKDTMTHAQFADDAEAIASHLCFDQVGVIGHSYGGFIALEFALRHPQRLSHLILVDTAPAMNYYEEIMANAVQKGATAEMLTVLNESWSTDEEMQARLPIIWPLYFKHFDPAVARRLTENAILNASGGAKEGELAAYNMISHLGQIHIPTLIIVGRDDFICPPSKAQMIHEGIENSELVIFENSGHLPWIEESEVFFTTVREWIKRTSPKSANEKPVRKER